MQERLQKALAAAGVASRRNAEEIIAAGRVSVDGETVTQPGTLVDSDTQKIEVDGQPLDTSVRRYYIALHKPIGYVSTVADRFAEHKVTDLVQIDGVRLVPAGRLDADSEGLILMSNDGDFVYRITHPSQSMGKMYHVTVQGSMDGDTVDRLSRGLMLPGEKRSTAPAGAKWLGKGPNKTTVLEMTLHEGRNRQIRRMMETVGHPVVRLMRMRVGPVWLNNLQPGQWRELTQQELDDIMAEVPEEPVSRTVRNGKKVVKSVRPMGTTRKVIVRPSEGRAESKSESRAENKRDKGPRSDAAPRPQPRFENERPQNRPNQNADRPQYGNRPQSRPPQGNDRPQYGNRPNFGGDRPRGNDRPQGNDRPRFDDRRPSPGNRPAYGQGRPPQGNDRPRFDDRRPSGDRPRFGEGRPGGNDRPQYGNRPQGNDRPRFGSDRPQGGDRPRFGNDRPQGGDRPRFGSDRPPQGNRPSYGQGRPSGGNYNNDRPRFGGDRPQGRPDNRGEGRDFRPREGNREEGSGRTSNQRPMQGRPAPGRPAPGRPGTGRPPQGRPPQDRPFDNRGTGRPPQGRDDNRPPRPPQGGGGRPFDNRGQGQYGGGRPPQGGNGPRGGDGPRGSGPPRFGGEGGQRGPRRGPSSRP